MLCGPNYNTQLHALICGLVGLHFNDVVDVDSQRKTLIAHNEGTLLGVGPMMSRLGLAK